MRATAVQHAALTVVELPEPVLGRGQVLLEVLRCGICGSDLHARHHADAQADVLAEAGYDGFMRSDQQVVLGHEFSGRILDHGPGRSKHATGTTVTALPLRRVGGEVHAIGLSASAPGAYAERVVVQESLVLPVPNGLSADLAALTEPMAVGLHAVRHAELGKRDVAVVVGCGPVGLAVICMLKARGARTVIASDPSPGPTSWPGCPSPGGTCGEPRTPSAPPTSSDRSSSSASACRGCSSGSSPLLRWPRASWSPVSA